jgi:hypothetical protein
MVPGLVLVALVLTAAGAARFGRGWAVVLAVLSVVWILVDRPMEGSVLVVLSHSHGITAADLAGVAGLALALMCFRRG